MRKIAHIGGLLKKIYRIYSSRLLEGLQARGFTDLRPSFLEVLLYVCEHEGPSIKDIGQACGLKKQTMTSHLNELEQRGYILRKINPLDKREQQIFLTEYGDRFKLNLLEAIGEIEHEFSQKIGMVEMDRIEFQLKNFYQRLNSSSLAKSKEVLNEEKSHESTSNLSLF